jgi:(2Fe-2S) ferredoxin
MATQLKECVHIFICTNKKAEGRCCAGSNTNDIFDYFKNAIANNISKLNNNFKYKVVKTSCLGRCSLGPNIFISPDNIWYNYSTTDDVDTIIDEHLVKGNIVKRLLQKTRD